MFLLTAVKEVMNQASLVRENRGSPVSSLSVDIGEEANSKSFIDVTASSESLTHDKPSPTASLTSTSSVDVFGYEFEELEEASNADDEDVFNGSPLRLRRREPSAVTGSDAAAAGFEPHSSVPRCVSTQSISFNTCGSQFTPSQLSLGGSREVEVVGREYATPTAVVGPRSGGGGGGTGATGSQSAIYPQTQHSHHQKTRMDVSGRDDEDGRRGGNRRSLQQLNASGRSEFEVSTSQFPFSSSSTDMRTLHHSQHRLHDAGQHQRRSEQHQHRLSSGGDAAPFYFDQTVVTSTPKPAHGSAHHSNRVAVAPQQQQHKARLHSYRNEDILPRTHHVAPERRSSNMTYHNERLVDGPPSPKDNRVASLEQRVRELESMMTVGASQPSTSTMVIPVTPTMQSKHHHHRNGSSGGNGSQQQQAPPTQLIISSSPGPAMTQQLMAKDIVEKELEIERLQSQLRKTYSKMEHQQQEYDDKVRRFKRDSETAKDELRRVINKLNELDEEYNKYRERAAAMGDVGGPQYEQMLVQLKQQESELTRAREEVAEKRELEKQLEQLQREIEYLDLQNNSLNKTLDVKEKAVKQLEDNISSMRLEASLYHQSCSSGSTPLADETESLADVRPSFFGGPGSTIMKPYTKAHSTLGAGGNLTPSSPLPSLRSTGGLRKSLSNFAIDAAARKDDVTAAMSQSIRTQQKRLADSRLMVRSITEAAEQIANGKAPDVAAILGIKGGDSMSETEPEEVESDSTVMSMAAAEKLMRRQEESMKKLENDLNQMRYILNELYNARPEDRDDEMCRVQ